MSGREQKESRDVLDALALCEAVSCSQESAYCFLAGVRGWSRYTDHPELMVHLNREQGEQARRMVETRGMTQASFGVRMLKSQVAYSKLPLESHLNEQIETAGPGGGGASELVFVFAAYAPADLLSEAFASDSSSQRRPKGVMGNIASLVSSTVMGRSPHRSPEVPSSSTCVLPNGRRPNFIAAACELASDVEQEVLEHDRHGHVVGIKAHYAPWRLVLTGHGAGALVAHHAVDLLLGKFPGTLTGFVRFVGFGMPMMGFGSVRDRDAGREEDCGTSFPERLRPYHYVVRCKDVVAAATLCGNSAREGLRDAVQELLTVRDEAQGAVVRHGLSPFAGAPEDGGPGADKVRDDLAGVCVESWWQRGLYWFLEEGRGEADDDDQTREEGWGVGVVEPGGGGGGQGMEAWLRGMGSGGEWLREHHLGRYVLGVHGSLARQPHVLQQRKQLCEEADRDAELAEEMGAGLQAVEARERGQRMRDLSADVGEACTPVIESVVGMCVREGAKTWLQVHVRGENLAYVESVLFRFRANTSHLVRVTPMEHLNRRITARCEGPFGLIQGGFEVTLSGSCFRDVGGQCGGGDLDVFEALDGHRKRYEDVPVKELLEKGFAYRELVRTCQLVTRERGGVEFKTPLSEDQGALINATFRRGGKGGGGGFEATAEQLLGSKGGGVFRSVVEGFGDLRRVFRRMDRERQWLVKVKGEGVEDLERRRDAVRRGLVGFRERMVRMHASLEEEGLRPRQVEGGAPKGMSLFSALEKGRWKGEGGGEMIWRGAVSVLRWMGEEGQEIADKLERGEGWGGHVDAVVAACAEWMGRRIEFMYWKSNIPVGALCSGTSGGENIEVVEEDAGLEDAEWKQFGVEEGESVLRIVRLFDLEFGLLENVVQDQGANPPQEERGCSADEVGVDLMDRLAGELKGMEVQTRGHWHDFKRLMSLGGADPSPERDDVRVLDGCKAQYREMVAAGEDPEQLMEMEIRPRFATMQSFLDRPLSLSMDRSPQARKVYSLLKAVTMGGTAVAGACLLAPATAAALVPTLAAAVLSPSSVVGGTAAGVFVTSVLQSHTQARSTLVGGYLDKLRHFAQALRVDTDRVIGKCYYLEKAIAGRIRDHIQSTPCLSREGEDSLLRNPKRFVELVGARESWAALVDPAHFFELADAKDKDVVVNFLWVVLCLYTIRCAVMDDTSVAVVGAKKAGKGATLNALFRVGTKSGFLQSCATHRVECYRLEGIPRPLRIDDFPGWGDSGSLSGGLTEIAYDLSAVQLVVIQWDALQRQDTSVCLARVLGRAKVLGTSFKVLLNKADQMQVGEHMESLLEEEVAVALRKLNETLDLSPLAGYVSRVKKLRQQATKKGERMPSLSECVQVCYEEGSLGPSQLPSAHQMSLLEASGMLKGGASEVVGGGELVLKRSDCMIVAMSPDPLLRQRVETGGLGNSVERVRGWLGGKLGEAMFGGGGASSWRGGVAARAGRVGSVFSPEELEEQVVTVQACVRRTLQQRRVFIHVNFDAFSSSWSHDLPAHPPFQPPTGVYWPPPQQQQPPVVVGGDPVVSVGQLVWQRGMFRLRFQQLLDSYFAQMSRVRQLARFKSEVSRVSHPPSPTTNTGKPSPPSVTHQRVREVAKAVFGGMDPHRVLEIDGQEGAGALLRRAFGSMPSAHEAPVGLCFDKCLAPLYTSMATLFCMVPLHHDASTVASLVKTLYACGDALPSAPLSHSLQAMASPLSLPEAIHAPYPPALHLRLLLQLLVNATPPCHPDLYDMQSALKIVDFHFASAHAPPPASPLAVHPSSSPTPRASLLGPFGDFFAAFESRYSPWNPSTPAAASQHTPLAHTATSFYSPERNNSNSITTRTPPSSVSSSSHPTFAPPEMLRDAVASVSQFRGHVLADLEGLGVGGGEGYDDAGVDGSSRGVREAVRMSVDSVILTRLWTEALQAAYAESERDRDYQLSLGLPAFDLRRDTDSLFSYLHLPRVLSSQGELGAAGGLLRPAVRALKMVGLEATPGGKLRQIAAAREEVFAGLSAAYQREGGAHNNSPASSMVVVGEDEVAPCLIYSILTAVEELKAEGRRCSFYADLRYITDLYLPLDLSTATLSTAPSFHHHHPGQVDHVSHYYSAYFDMFSAMLDWILATAQQMLQPATPNIDSPSSCHSSSGGDTGPNAYRILVSKASQGDFEGVSRLVGDIGLSPTVQAGEGLGSALEAASREGHGGLVLYLLFRMAKTIPHGPHGNLEFSSGGYKHLQAAGASRHARAQEVFTLRALEMLRSHETYTQRLRCVHAAVGERQPWMSEAHYRTLFSNVALNLGHAEEVLSEFTRVFEACIEARTVLTGFGATLMLGKGSALQLSIRMVLHQYDEVVEAGTLLSELCGDESGEWLRFVREVEADPLLQGQRLIDLLTEPCQRAIRYSTETIELLKAAVKGNQDTLIGDGSDGSVACDVTYGQARDKPSEELAVKLEEWVQQGGGGGEYVADVPNVMRACVALQKEAIRLNTIRSEREKRFKAAERAQTLLKGMINAEELLQSPVGVAAQASARCDLDGVGGGCEHDYSLLLISGAGAELLICSDLAIPSRRACQIRCPVACITAISTASTPGEGGGLTVTIGHRSPGGDKGGARDGEIVLRASEGGRGGRGGGLLQHGWLQAFAPMGTGGPDVESLGDFVAKLRQAVETEADKRRSIRVLMSEDSMGM